VFYIGFSLLMPVIIYIITQGDHLSGKPGKPVNVWEFDSCQPVREMSGILLKIREMSGKKSCRG